VGLTSAALADCIPRSETVFDLVRTAAYGQLGRWREKYDELDDERAHELMKRLGIDTFAHRIFGTLSEGERKRTQIARALMTDPELLLLDEPSAGLDLGGREALVATLGAIATDPESPASVLVTHHVEEIPEGFGHVLLLAQGRLIAAGPIQETLTGENLSVTFGVPLTVGNVAGRWSARSR
jgi:iron complex transport system ATP-binding protein